VIVGDCEDRIDVPEQFFDRIIAIHVLEHLTNLPKALDELVRVLAPGGRLSVVIPCEGGLLYFLG
jgi:ubiquinone/menaquinone biosynthesis C-methylase UbiE